MCLNLFMFIITHQPFEYMKNEEERNKDVEPQDFLWNVILTQTF